MRTLMTAIGLILPLIGMASAQTLSDSQLTQINPGGPILITCIVGTGCITKPAPLPGPGPKPPCCRPVPIVPPVGTHPINPVNPGGPRH